MPYFRTGIQSLVPKEVPGLGTMGVTDGNVLLVDYDVLGKLTAPEAATLILHEYMHRYLQHAERFEKLVKAGVLSRTPEDMKDWNVAGDAEINDNLIEANCPLPKIDGADG